MSYPGNLTVANISALTRMSLANGESAYVLTVLDPWQFVSSGAEFTVDHITVEATVLGGNTRWVRSLSCNPIWRLGRDAWYVDPTDGNDENDGTVAHPIKTCNELARRWGSQNLVTQSGSSSNFGVNIHLLGDIVAPDSLQIDVRVNDSTEIFVVGTPTTIIASPAGATAITVENQPTNTPWSLVDAVTAASITAGARLRWTAGAAINACAYAAKSQPGSTWRFSQPQLSNLASFQITPTPKNPSVGDAYVVERLTHVEFGYFNVTQMNLDVSFGTFVFVSDCQITANSIIQQLNYGTNSTFSTFYGFNQCQFACAPSASSLIFSNCGFLNSGIFYGVSIVSGGMFLPGTQGIVVWSASSQSILNNDVLIQGAGLIVLNSVVGNVGIFDTTGVLSGSAVIVGPLAGTSDTIAPVNALINDLVWGSGNAGVGLHVQAGSRVVLSGAVPSVTGTLGDFALATTGQERTFINGSGTYSAAPIAPTWVNFADPASFNHNAHNLQQDSHLVTL